MKTGMKILIPMVCAALGSTAVLYWQIKSGDAYIFGMIMGAFSALVPLLWGKR